MNLAKISANGQITVPVEVRRQLGLKSGDKLLFLQKQNGEIIVSNASATAIRKAQAAFQGVAEEMGINSEEDIQKFVNNKSQLSLKNTPTILLSPYFFQLLPSRSFK